MSREIVLCIAEFINDPKDLLVYNQLCRSCDSALTTTFGPPWQKHALQILKQLPAPDSVPSGRYLNRHYRQQVRPCNYRTLVQLVALSGCQKCGKARIRKVNWTFHIRYCQSCLEKSVISEIGLRDLQIDPSIYCDLPVHLETKWNQLYKSYSIKSYWIEQVNRVLYARQRITVEYIRGERAIRSIKSKEQQAICRIDSNVTQVERCVQQTVYQLENIKKRKLEEEIQRCRKRRTIDLTSELQSEFTDHTILQVCPSFIVSIQNATSTAFSWHSTTARTELIAVLRPEYEARRNEADLKAQIQIQKCTEKYITLVNWLDAVFQPTQFDNLDASCRWIFSTAALEPRTAQCATHLHRLLLRCHCDAHRWFQFLGFFQHFTHCSQHQVNTHGILKLSVKDIYSG